MKNYGGLVTFILATGIIFSVFHKTILHANEISFAWGGDGMKSTYGTIYHLKHDTSYWHTNAMNYPFGESVFFTGNQVVFTNILKVIQDITGKDLSVKALGLSNLWILFSFVLCALFVYLIMVELKLPWWYATLGALIIVLLSTQWERLSGHYNLAVAFAIPIPVYLLMRFYKKPAYLTSVLFGLFMILISAKHMYFATIILMLVTPYWIFMFLSKEKRGGKWYEILSHFSLQIVFPLLIFLIFSGMHDEAIDRTSYPWGFYFSRMKPEAIFLPISLPHGQFMEFKGRYGSTSYISLVGTFFFLLIVYRFLRNTLRRDSNMAFRIGESTTFTWIFWGSILCLLLSFGFPFSLGYEKLLNYTGPFRQFRAPGRWVIPFYYIMTITAFYLLWLWYKKSEWKWKPILFFAALLFMAFESIMHIRALPAHFSNRFVMLNDWENEREENSWVKAHDWSKYQAIMPLPFFHVGSENYWLNDRSPADIPAYIVSIKTGLPLNAVMLSRTSISESLLNIDLVYEPYHKYEILDILPSNKPFLILVPKNASLSPNEQDLVSKATLLEKNDKLRLYALEIDSIKSLISDRQEELLVMSEVDSLISEFSIYMDYNEEKEGCFSGELKNPVTFFEGVVIDSGLYTVSFWYEGVEHDLWPRSLFVAELYRSNGEKYHYMQNDLFRAMALRDNSWGLVEFDLNLKEPDTKIVLSVGNKYITGGSIQIDNVLVRRSGKVNVFVDEFGTRINNRELLLEN